MSTHPSRRGRTGAGPAGGTSVTVVGDQANGDDSGGGHVPWWLVSGLPRAVLTVSGTVGGHDVIGADCDSFGMPEKQTKGWQ